MTSWIRENIGTGTAFPGELLQHMHLVAIVLDRKAIVRYANEYLLDLTGWQFDEILNKSWFEVFVPRQHPELIDVFDDLINDKPKAWHHENSILTKKGKLLHIRWNNTVIRNHHGDIIGAASVGEDVTERRELERTVLEAISVEQQRLSMEIHDGLGQDLFGVALLAKSIASIAKQEAPELAAELLRLSEITSKLIGTCRDIAHGMSPLNGIQGGLAEALRQITTMPSDWHGPVVHYEVYDDAPLSLPLDTLNHIYRIAQEAFVNAIKHSNAKNIKVKLQITSLSVRLEIVDDGDGLSKNPNSRVGMGLKAMKYRADLIHANFSRRAVAPSGTLIACEVAQAQTSGSRSSRRSRPQ